MIVSVHQPQYLPWLGYFDKIARSDVFVFLDTVQFKKNEYQNRNRIRTPDGWQWLTVPVRYRFPERICDVRVNADVPWQRKQMAAIQANYSKAPFFEETMQTLQPILDMEWEGISALNRRTVTDLLARLGIRRTVRSADEWDLPESPSERLAVICEHLEADTYLSGSGGRGYLDEGPFHDRGIRVVYQHYEHPTYPQRFEGFEPYMSVVDLLFNCGPDSASVLSP